MEFRQPDDPRKWPSNRLGHMVLPYLWNSTQGFLVFGGGQSSQTGFLPAEDSWFYNISSFLLPFTFEYSFILTILETASGGWIPFASRLNKADTLLFAATVADTKNNRVISLGGIPYFNALLQLGFNGSTTVSSATSWKPLSTSTVRVYYVDDSTAVPTIDLIPVVPSSGSNQWSIPSMQFFFGAAAFYSTGTQYEVLAYGGLSLVQQDLSSRFITVADHRFVQLVAGCQSFLAPNASTGRCDPCPKNYRSRPLPNRATCQLCPAGYNTDGPGQECKLCPFGFYRLEKDLECIACGENQGSAPDRRSCINLNNLAAPTQPPPSPLYFLFLLLLLFPVPYLIYRYRLQKAEQRKLDAILGQALDEKDFDYAFLRYSDLEIGEELGSGSFGSVYKGTHKGQIVAVKVSKPGVVEGIRDFLQEAETMMAMKPHPYVMQLVGVCTHAGSALVVLEFVSGGSLDKFLLKGGSFSETKLKEIIYEIVSGLKHLHESNVIHRDLAARNILLDKDENGEVTAKISDFGMSRVLEAEQRKGQTVTEFGPVPWMAPEAIGELKYSSESDMWSLGVTIWELITRQDPSKQMPLVDLAIAIRDSGFHPRVPSWAPEWLKQILDGCWRKNPDERITTDEIIELLGKSSDEAALQQELSKGAANPNYATIDPAKKKRKTTKFAKDKVDATEELAAMLVSIKEGIRQAEKKLQQSLDRNAELRAALGEPPRDAESQSFAPPQAFAPPSEGDDVGRNQRASGWRRSQAPSGMSNTHISKD
jgi:serine/threonine protein kinase